MLKSTHADKTPGVSTGRKIVAGKALQQHSSLPMRITRRSATVCAILAATLLLSSCSTNSSQTSAKKETTPIAVIGDSLTEHLVPYLPEQLEGTRYHASLLFGRSGYSMFELVREEHGLQTLPPLPDTVIVALGTVDIRRVSPTTQEELIAEVLHQIGPQRRVIWINTYIDDNAPNPDIGPPLEPVLEQGAHTKFNELLIEAQAHYPNLEVADWDAFVSRGGAVPTDDGVHYTAQSNRTRAAFYQEALDGAHSVTHKDGQATPLGKPESVTQRCVLAAELAAFDALGGERSFSRRVYGQALTGSSSQVAIAFAYGPGGQNYAVAAALCADDGRPSVVINGQGTITAGDDPVTQEALRACGVRKERSHLVLAEHQLRLRTSGQDPAECRITLTDKGSIEPSKWEPATDITIKEEPDSNTANKFWSACLTQSQPVGPTIITGTPWDRANIKGTPPGQAVAVVQVDDAQGGYHCHLLGNPQNGYTIKSEP